MRYILLAILVGSLAVTAFAGNNPRARLRVTFCDLDVNVHRFDPVASVPFTAYFVLDCLEGDGAIAASGVTAVSFLLERTFSGYNIGNTNLLGGQALGGPEDPTGWALTAFDCVTPADPGPSDPLQIYVASADYIYDGVTPGYIKILGHPVDGKMVVDCDQYEADFWCVYSHGGVWQDPPDPDPSCDYCDTPVEARGWGVIKALYR